MATAMIFAPVAVLGSALPRWRNRGAAQTGVVEVMR
jgi:hypothetical protein